MLSSRAHLSAEVEVPGSTSSWSWSLGTRTARHHAGAEILSPKPPDVVVDRGILMCHPVGRLTEVIHAKLNHQWLTVRRPTYGWGQ